MTEMLNTEIKYRLFFVENPATIVMKESDTVEEYIDSIISFVESGYYLPFVSAWTEEIEVTNVIDPKFEVTKKATDEFIAEIRRMENEPSVLEWFLNNVGMLSDYFHTNPKKKYEDYSEARVRFYYAQVIRLLEFLYDEHYDVLGEMFFRKLNYVK